MPTPTYDLIASNVLSSSASSVAFSSIPATYRDLVLVVNTTTSGSGFLYVRLNSDSGSNYSTVRMQGNGTTATSESETVAQLRGSFARDYTVTSIFQFMDYSATDKHKTVLANPERGEAQDLRGASANRWANTAAISTITCTGSAGNFPSGSTFYLYGIVS